ncbi:MAG: hypothetical protein E6767_18855 [Dysgonomonas sp.]|nr:hypothetical protein [Dysgonomonas sp.]
MARRNKPPDFLVQAKKILQQRPRMVAIESQKFFKDCFQKGGFTDEAFLSWKERLSPLGGKKVLIGKDNTMNLMQSIRVLEEGEERVRVGTDLVYAETHNEGAQITVTDKMKKFWWAMYYEFAGKVRRTQNGRISQSRANLIVNAKAEYCKNMALMKVGSKVKIPKRQFIGESKTLMKQFEEWWEGEMDKLK